MRKCYLIRFLLDDNGDIHLEAGGNDLYADYKTQRIILGDAALPLETLEVALMRAVDQLRQEGWTFSERGLPVEIALKRLGNFVRDLRCPSERKSWKDSDSERMRSRRQFLRQFKPCLDDCDYVFLVDCPVDKARFDRVGLNATIYDPKHPPKERIIVCVWNDIDDIDRVVEELKDGWNHVLGLRALTLLCDPEEEMRLAFFACMHLDHIIDLMKSRVILPYDSECPF